MSYDSYHMKQKVNLTNELGMSVVLSNYGAAIYDITLKMKDGTLRPVTVHPIDDEAFDTSPGYFGKTIGRNAGRLKDGRCIINGQTYQVKESQPKNGLHGGSLGLSYAEFKAAPYSNSNGKGMIFSYLSKHLIDGFPGNLHVFVTYFLYKSENKLEIRYEAKSDADTICNLTNHVYFNLDGGGSIRDHSLMISANEYISVDKSILPIARKKVDEVMDFSKAKKIGTHLDSSDLISVSGGYDHPFLINKKSVQEPNVTLTSANQDVILNLYTTYPSLVFYSGNYPTSEVMNTTEKLNVHEALTLEPQYVPDAMNQDFGQEKTGLFKAGHRYPETILYEFITK